MLKAQVSGNALTFEIGDDGRGIDWDAVARKAGDLGLPNKTPQDLLQALCRDGVSTRESVSETSGRGVGMAAFKHQVELLGGRLEVRSSRGVGTSWIIRLPWTQPGAPKPRRNGRGDSLAPSSTS